MNIDFSVIVIKDDGTRVLTNVIEPGDNLEGGTSYEEIAKRLETPEGQSLGWQRTDRDDDKGGTVTVQPVVAEVEHPEKPSEDASKKEWFEYAAALGFTGDYDGITKGQLQRFYGDIDSKGVIGA